MEHLFLSKLLIVISANKAKKFTLERHHLAPTKAEEIKYLELPQGVYKQIYLQRSQLLILNNWKKAVLGSFSLASHFHSS